LLPHLPALRGGDGLSTWPHLPDAPGAGGGAAHRDDGPALRSLPGLPRLRHRMPERGGVREAHREHATAGGAAAYPHSGRSVLPGAHLQGFPLSRALASARRGRSALPGARDPVARPERTLPEAAPEAAAGSRVPHTRSAEGNDSRAAIDPSA